MIRRLSALIVAILIAAGVPVALQAQQVQQPAQTTTTGRGSSERPSQTLQGFNIVLLVGETQQSGQPVEEVPAATRKALNDMREFLPFKHYRVLDSQWTSCCTAEMLRLSGSISGRLQGVTSAGSDGAIRLVPRNYAFSISVSQDATRLPVRFSLAAEESGGVARERVSSEKARNQVADLRAELNTAAFELQRAQSRFEVGTGSELEVRQVRDRHAQLERQVAEATNALAGHSSAVGRPIIDSSFTMEVGETVVVGTSRLGGDKALIAIVTAVRKVK